MAKRNLWTRDQQLLAFRLYCNENYGRLYAGNPEVVRYAEIIGRTPDAVAMKACNFASFDRHHADRGVSGLTNASKADRELWGEFEADSERIAAETEEVWDRATASEPGAAPSDVGVSAAVGSEPARPVDEPPAGPTDVEQTVRVRRVQRFFRTAVLTSYDNRCALSGVPLPELLNASHIIPWSADVSRRADPRNGIALHALYDRAFDRGYLSFDETLCVILSPALRIENPPPLHVTTLLDLEGRPLTTPNRAPPDPQALAWHRERVFRA